MICRGEKEICGSLKRRGMKEPLLREIDVMATGDGTTRQLTHVSGQKEELETLEIRTYSYLCLQHDNQAFHHQFFQAGAIQLGGGGVQSCASGVRPEL